MCLGMCINVQKDTIALEIRKSVLSIASTVIESVKMITEKFTNVEPISTSIT